MQWAKDYAEVKKMGAKTGWRARRNRPRSLAFGNWWDQLRTIPSRVSYRRRRSRRRRQCPPLRAVFYRCVCDAGVAIFEAKYKYNFWRPVTAIRNGDLDGNNATERDPNLGALC